MKKLEFKALELGMTEVLSRDQLKKLLGGSNPGGGDSCQNECGGSTGGTCDDGCHCGSVPCPDDTSLTHAICLAD